MKATIASTVISLSLFTLVSAFEVPERAKMSIGSAPCTNIHLTDKYTLNAECAVASKEFPEPPVPLSLDLNKCFANYLGTLNYVPRGGFGASCPECHLDDERHKMICQCSVGEGQGTKETIADLDLWRVIKVAGYGSQDMIMSCHSTYGIEKRIDAKEARPFVA